MHQGYSADTAGVDRGKIRSSIRAGNFLPDHTRSSHKNWSALVGVGRLSGVNVALHVGLGYLMTEVTEDRRSRKAKDL